MQLTFSVPLCAYAHKPTSARRRGSVWPRMAADDRADRCPVRTGTGADSRGALASRSKLYNAGGLPLWAAAVALDGRVRDASLP